MARPVFGRGSAGLASEAPGWTRPAEVGRSRVAYLDRDRPLVEAARRDPSAFEPLYRRYLAQVYSYAYYELGDHHDAEDATERTFLLALTHLGRFEERAQPSDGEGASTFRVWLFRIARNVVANQRRAHRRRSEAPLEAAAVIHDPLDVERDADGSRGRRRAWAAVGRAARRPPAGGRPALRRRDVDGRDRRGARPLRGRRARAHPPRPPERRPRPRPVASDEPAAQRARRGGRAPDRPLSRRAAGRPGAPRDRRADRGRPRPGRPGRRATPRGGPRSRPPVVPLRGAPGGPARRGGGTAAPRDGGRRGGLAGAPRLPAIPPARRAIRPTRSGRGRSTPTRPATATAAAVAGR